MNAKELVVTSVETQTSELTGNKFDLVTLKQVAGLSVTGAIKFAMSKGQPLMARRISNVGRIVVGDVVDGSIVSVKTTDYAIGDRTANSYTVAVYEGESATDLVNESFKRQGISACALDGKGQPTLDLTPVVEEGNTAPAAQPNAEGADVKTEEKEPAAIV